MNVWLLAAGILSLVTALVHIFAGGPEIHDVVQAAPLPLVPLAAMAVIWHAVSALLVINSIVLLYVARHRRASAALVPVLAQYLAFAVLFVVYDLWRLDSLLAMPQWTVFLVIPVLAAIGLRQRGKTAGR